MLIKVNNAFTSLGPVPACNVSVKSKLKHPPRAFDVFSCLGGRGFDELSLPGGGEFDHYS